MPLRVLIVDDEPPARDRLARMLAPFLDRGEIGVLDQAEDGVDALAVMDAADAPYDLVFLDVRMPELDGFDVLDRLDPAHRPAVVFTTAYDEYAVRAFEANAVDYLLKPVAAERLADAVGRAQAGAGDADARVDRLASLLDDLDEPPPPAPAQSPMAQFTVQAADRLVVVRTDEIVSVEVQDGITNLYVLPAGAPASDLERHIVGFTLDALHARLDADRFMRVHRGAIVALEHVRELVPWFSGRYRLVLTGGHDVVASRARSRELKERLSL